MTNSVPVIRPADDGHLGLSRVLATTLPDALGTPEAPDRYSVTAMLTRRPSHFEIAAIHSRETSDRLDRAGYPTVELSVSDRRLQIANTSLEELRDGLSTVLADLIRDISLDGRENAAALAEIQEDRSQEELDRVSAVLEIAESVHFLPSRPAR
ncbi:hypothetical protein [Gryllotalpicola kribbensis]|uniref:hypothetical protein n=1 Tax=Gryllotalpicola kribbensis TaxID=993084 RepID=UPI0031D8ABCD